MDTIQNGYRALLIDDDQKILGIYRDLLTSRGYTVTTCSDSAKAVPLLKGDGYDVVLLDIRMPGLEGTDLLPLIKKLHPNVPVILVSAYGDAAHQGYYHSLGASEIISKPFSHEVFMDAVERAVHRQEHIPIVLTSFSLQAGREQVYRKLILSALQKTKWNRVKAAELLGVSRYCLMRWVKKLGISCS